MERRKLLTFFGLGTIAVAILLIFTKRGEAAVIEEVPVNLPSKVRQWWSLIIKHAKNFGVDPNLVASIIQQESGGDPNARGSSGEIGLMQVMPATSIEMGVNPTLLSDPDWAIYAGTKYLARQMSKYGNNYWQATFAYNAGAFPRYDNPTAQARATNYANSVTSIYTTLIV